MYLQVPAQRRHCNGGSAISQCLYVGIVSHKDTPTMAKPINGVVFLFQVIRQLQCFIKLRFFVSFSCLSKGVSLLLVSVRYFLQLSHSRITTAGLNNIPNAGNDGMLGNIVLPLNHRITPNYDFVKTLAIIKQFLKIYRFFRSDVVLWINRFLKWWTHIRCHFTKHIMCGSLQQLSEIKTDYRG